MRFADIGQQLRAYRLESGLRAEEIAARLGVSPATVRQKAAAGLIPAFKIGKLWRFRADLIEQLIAALEDEFGTE